MNIEEVVVQRFIKYVQFETTSDPMSSSIPSTPTQIEFEKYLQNELNEMGIKSELTQTGHLFAYLSNSPTLAFFGHVDTSNNAPGKNVKPLIHVVGTEDIHLPLNNIILTAKELMKYQGKKIITSSGDTLLGADDKCAVAILMTICEMYKNKEVPVVIVFTPDEEIGRSITHLDINKIKTKKAYSLDGNELGTYSTENFNAINCFVQIEGTCCPNALLRYLELKPINHPSLTKDKEGFVLCTSSKANETKASSYFIIRSFEEKELQRFVQIMNENGKIVENEYPVKVSIEMKRMYSNIQRFYDCKVLEDNLINAMKRCGVVPIKKPFRGGFDSCWLCEKGIESINFFSGGINFHSRREFAVVESMVKAVEIVNQLIIELN
ncbi:hypothetical protein ENUP19_0378G0024 [Entamoeba nuttalli]|uniref:Peptidase T, putative n=2 Tax=Entamoeba nuttalli TaxID=412467 RepID=K2H7D8_ENTNP|nr:peptidase T, putative [Entamoeba nuttalli P19]EKE38439.1 peptidase T, putative [Entamoeba nuttalli P19]|eukprot:XP_008859228.1 peptidase T, putative [Entamoeba nuttalli P19]